jgi:HEAT repeats
MCFPHQAAEALAKVKTPASLAPLINAHDDPSDGVRDSVAIALGELRDPGAVEPLFAVVLKKRGPYLPGGWTSERVEETLERITGKSWKNFNYNYQKWLAWWRGIRQ